MSAQAEQWKQRGGPTG